METPWTVETLREHMTKMLEAKEQRDTERFQAQREMTALALTASDRAVTKAETATEKRFDAVNEFRATLSDQARNLMPRAETELQFKSINADIALMKEQFLAQRGVNTGLHQGWIIFIGALGAAGTIFGIISFLHKL